MTFVITGFFLLSAQIHPFSFVYVNIQGMPPDFTKLTLSNGLLVLLKEIHTAPLISHWVWYRVGSRYETPGITGASHWVEHMQFKGTPQFPTSVLDKAISRKGGYWNAFTYLDWTTYFETLPAGEIDLALRLEADRMANSLFDPQEVESERTVIISERQGSENEPLFRLAEQVQTASFHSHPYQHQVIGSLDDLRTMQREHLYQHYRSFYTPSNAVLAIAGDFHTDEMLSRIREVYETIGATPAPARPVQSEPPQNGEQRLTVEGPGDTVYIEIAYHVPQASHPDFLPLTVLDSLLSGATDLNMFGGGISNKTSRLYRRLVEGELAITVSGSIQATIDPYLYSIIAILHPGSSFEKVVDAIDQEIRSVQENKPGVEELMRAVKQERALFAYGSESITNQAFWLGFAEMFDTYDWFSGCLDRLAAVTPEDLLRVAQEYLQPKNRVVGVYLPSGNGE